KIFGKTERYAFGSISRSAASMPPWHPVRSRPRRRWHLARLALPRADRGVGLQHHSVLGFGRIEQRAALYLYGYRFYRPLDHFCRRASLRCKRGLDVLDHGFKLLVRQVLERIAVFDLVLARDKQGETSQVHPRLLAAHLGDGLLPVLGEIPHQCANHRLAQPVTRATQSPSRVS